jgi:putative DNA primase/helicase
MDATQKQYAFDTSRAKNIPAWMQFERRWILWRSIVRGGKPTKIPWSVYDSPASSTDAATWHDFECAVVQFRHGYHAGLGFVLGDTFAGLDLDGCRCPQTGVMDAWAGGLLSRANEHDYAEVSPSGTGVKLFFRSRRSIGGVNRKIGQPAKFGKEPGIELYSGGRFFCVTGLRIPVGGQTNE